MAIAFKGAFKPLPGKFRVQGGSPQSIWTSHAKCGGVSEPVTTTVDAGSVTAAPTVIVDYGRITEQVI